MRLDDISPVTSSPIPRPLSIITTTIISISTADPFAHQRNCDICFALRKKKQQKKDGPPEFSCPASLERLRYFYFFVNIVL